MSPISSITSFVSDHCPTTSQIVKGALVTTATAIALNALSSAPVASAGPITYAGCAALCAAGAPAAFPACMTGCLAFSGPWCP